MARSKSARGGPALGPFLQQLGVALDSLSPDEIRQSIKAYATELLPAEREPFLAMLVRKEAPRQEAGPLLDDIDDLLARIRAGEFYDGYGWDHEIYAERAFGDDSWADEMDDLFSGAANAFVNGDFDLAWQAYSRLLRAIWGGEESEQLSGAEDPIELLKTDLAEAKTRCLRALYEVTPAPDRPSALLDALYAFAWSGRSVTLQNLREARPVDLADVTTFLPAWIAGLKTERRAGFDQQARQLLSEATVLHEGLDGLTTLARERGVRQPEIYLDLVQQLVSTDRGRAITAAREALTAPVPRGEVRAQIADALAEQSAEIADQAEARREAWRAGPNAARLVNLAATAISASQGNRMLNDEAEFVLTDRREGDAPSDRLVAILLMLAGRLDQAVERARQARPDWSSPDHPGYAVIPALLVASARPALLPGSALEECIAGIDRSEWYDHRQLFETARADLNDGADAEESNESRSDKPMLANLIRSRLPLTVMPADRDRWITAAQGLVQTASRSVLEAKQRHSYERIARVAVAMGEAMAEDRQGERFVADLLASYPRHTAFRRELENAWRRSPVIKQSAPYPRRR